jgi:hypothetical protein
VTPASEAFVWAKAQGFPHPVKFSRRARNYWYYVERGVLDPRVGPKTKDGAGQGVRV